MGCWAPVTEGTNTQSFWLPEKQSGRPGGGGSHRPRAREWINEGHARAQATQQRGKEEGPQVESSLVSGLGCNTTASVRAVSNPHRTAESYNTRPRAFCPRPGHLPWQGAVLRRLRPFLHLCLACNAASRQLFWAPAGLQRKGNGKFARPSTFLNKGSTESGIELILLFITT